MSDKYCGFFPATQVFSVAAFGSRALICDCSDQDINFTVICRYLSFFDMTSQQVSVSHFTPTFPNKSFAYVFFKAESLFLQCSIRVYAATTYARAYFHPIPIFDLYFFAVDKSSAFQKKDSVVKYLVQ